MRKKLWFFLILASLECSLSMGREIVVQEKSDTAIPLQTLSPPEGNTTFIDGTTWCVALAGASPTDLQNALDWACGLGRADCTAILKNGACFEPDTLASHASFAFNNYYQTNGNSDIACNFGGTATLTKKDPSYGKCVYPTSGSRSLVSSAPPSLRKHDQNMVLPKLATVLMLLLSYFLM